MPVDWTIVSNFATACSALVGGGSLLSGFYLYRVTKRDEKALKFRDAVVTARTLSKQLDTMLNFEMGYEVAQSVTSSSQLQVFLRPIHSAFFTAGAQRTSQELKDSIKTHIPMIVAAIHSPISDAFQEKLAQLEKEQADIQFDHPGVARVVRASFNVLANTFRGQKRLVHDEKAWEMAVVQLHENKRQLMEQYDAFQNTLIEMFVATWMQGMKDVNQPNIDDTLASLHLVTERYLTKSSRDLVRLSRYEKTRTMVAVDKTKHITEDLREAEQCLSCVLTQQEVLLLRQYSTQIEARSMKGAEKGE